MEDVATQHDAHQLGGVGGKLEAPERPFREPLRLVVEDPEVAVRKPGLGVTHERLPHRLEVAGQQDVVGVEEARVAAAGLLERTVARG